MADKICCHCQFSTLICRAVAFLTRRSFSGGGSEGGTLNYQLGFDLVFRFADTLEWDPLWNDPRFQKILAGPEPKTLRDNVQ
jgi:hypothetical protein